MKKFYGKSLTELTFGELTLLSVDIQILSFEKFNIPIESLIDESMKIREVLVGKCMLDGGDYSRDRFLRDFEGKEVVGLGTDFSVYELVGQRMLN
jgi:hypothetical protein